MISDSSLNKDGVIRRERSEQPVFAHSNTLWAGLVSSTFSPRGLNLRGNEIHEFGVPFSNTGSRWRSEVQLLVLSCGVNIMLRGRQSIARERHLCRICCSVVIEIWGVQGIISLYVYMCIYINIYVCVCIKRQSLSVCHGVATDSSELGPLRAKVC